MKKKIMVVSILVTILVLLSGCVSSPKPVILSKNAEVKAPDKETMNQRQVTYIEKGMIKTVRFTFDTEFGDKVYYSVTAEPV